jgi:integrase
MPRVAKSGTKSLIKKHNQGCTNKGRPTACDCPWYGRYKHIKKSLSDWCGYDLDPHQKKKAAAVLNRLKAAIDEDRYSAEGEEQSLGSAQAFKAFTKEWTRHYAEEYDLSSNSLQPMLGVLTSLFGGWTMEHLAGASKEIERRLNEEARERKWSDNTWNRYHELLSTVLNRAKKWKVVSINPMEAIERRVGSKGRQIEVRIEEDAEKRLLDACAELNRPQHRPHSRRLTWEKVDEIRAAVAAGEQQKIVAGRFGISRGLCCQIVKGEIWNRDKYKQGTKGDEMRLRLLGAFDTGLRESELMAVQLKHVDFRPVTVEVDGEKRSVFRITLPAKATKGGKTTGEPETVYVGSERLKDALVARRFELGKKPEAFVFGRRDGKYQKGFRRMWRELFTLAGLDWGRDKGLVWHTLRHEFTSRALEMADGDPIVAQKMARHKDLRTTQSYLHARDKRLMATAAKFGRG